MSADIVPGAVLPDYELSQVVFQPYGKTPAQVLAKRRDLALRDPE